MYLFPQNSMIFQDAYLAHDDGLRLRVLHWAVGAAQHLDHLHHRVVVVGVHLAVVVLRVHDDHEVAADGERPGERARHHADSDYALGEEELDSAALHGGQTCR